MIMRLDKMLAHLGYGSRKDVKQLIRKKEVLVNGNVITNDDYKVDSENDEVVVFNEVVNYSELVYIMLNKPENVVSATYDAKLKTVIDLLDVEYQNRKLFPVGRLDIDTVGLLLITNDGKLCHELLAPKKHVDKIYYVKFEGIFKDTYYDLFNSGIILEDGYKTLPSSIKLESDNEAYITIHEGKFHQVKRMFEALNMKVIYLKRIQFKNLKLDENLKEGEYRLLTNKEIADLKND
ncbi:MAG: 16S rRNA pseudouridine(516) synthase [Candidatus Caccosoma sp.]|nr:16S rRNA pseudouridine(516) synthase [Candidatus Caccosoma sp.]